LHLIDGTGEDIGAAYALVREEVRRYGQDLDQKAEVVALNKCDALDDAAIAAQRAALEAVVGAPVATISGVTGAGVPEILYQLLTRIEDARATEQEDAPQAAWQP
jgi:GTP-binding protein